MPGKVRIVIADDHTIFRDGLRRLLEMEEDLEVVGEAADGAAAVAMVESHGPSILLLDLAMPRMPGLETLRELGRRQSHTRTILLTAAIERRQILEALQAGARGVVLKEAATQVLLKAIRAVEGGSCWVGDAEVADLEANLRTLGNGGARRARGSPPPPGRWSRPAPRPPPPG